MYQHQTYERDSLDAEEPAQPQPSVMTLDDCLDFVWRLARDGGLSPDQASDVCVITLLRLSEQDKADDGLTRNVARWVLRVAVEECRTSRRLADWRRPRLIGFDNESNTMGAQA